MGLTKRECIQEIQSWEPKTLPDHLSVIWDEMKGQIYESIQPAGLEALCVQVHRMRDAQMRIQEDGAVVNDGKGTAVPHPAIAIEKAAGAEVRTWLAKFGVGQ